MAGLRAVAVSPDTAFVYGVSGDDDSLTIFARDPGGALTFVDAVGGLDEAGAVEVSPDGIHVYVAAGGSDRIVGFERSSDGRLHEVGSVTNGIGGVVGIGGARDVAVSQDGQNLYVAGFNDDALAVFTRNPVTGILQFEQVVPGLGGIAGVALSPDGAYAYAASYLDDSIVSFERNAADGTLTGIGIQRNGIGGVSGLSGVSALVASPDGERVYAVGLDAMTVFGREPSSGRLSFLESKDYFAPHIDCPAGPNAAIAISADRRRVYAARSLDAAVAAFELTGDGDALVLRDLVEGGGRSCSGAMGLSIALDAPDDTLYVTGLDNDELAVFVSLRGAGGALARIETHENGAGGVAGLSGPTTAIVSPDDTHLYVAGAPGTLSAFSRSALDGSLRFIEVARNGVEGVAGLAGATTIAASPDGRNLYVASSGDTLSVFERRPDTGRLTFLEVKRNGVAGVDGLAGASSARVSPDGAHVYVASEGDSAVTVFLRDQGTGRLTFVEEQREGAGGVDGIADASAIAISRDGAHVYVAGSAGTLALFSRNLPSGGLAHITTYTNRAGGIDGLAGASAVEVSPGDGHVYVAGFLDAAIAIFVRDRATGALGFVDVERAPAADSLSGVTSIALTEDGTGFYAGTIGGSLLAFSRSPGIGALTMIDVLEDGVNGVDGLAGTTSLAVSADGQSVYATGSTDAALAVLRARR